MNHNAIRASLSAFVDGMAEDAEGIDAHLRGCTACRQEVENLRLIVNVLKKAPSAPLPRHFFIDDLQLHRYRRKQRTRAVSWVVRSVGAAAAVLLIFVGGADVATEFSLSTAAIAAPASLSTQSLSAAPLTVSSNVDRALVGDASATAPTANTLNPTHSVNHQSPGLLHALEAALGVVLAGAVGAWVWMNKLVRG